MQFERYLLYILVTFIADYPFKAAPPLVCPSFNNYDHLLKTYEANSDSFCVTLHAHMSGAYLLFSVALALLQAWDRKAWWWLGSF